MLTILGGKLIMQIDLSNILFFKKKKLTKPVLLSQQGFSNKNYSFYADKKRYLLRRFKLKDRDRTLEYEVQDLAYQHALAAKPLYLDLEEGFMVCEYVDGEHQTNLSRIEIALLASQLQILHSLKINQSPLDLKSEFPTLTKELEEAFNYIETTSSELVLCHNDLNPLNCIFSKENLTLIDWEFAAMNDRYFDLASVSVEFQFELLDDAYLLASYFGREGWDKKKFDAYKVIYKALCEKWFKENT
jgi:thiamine kinase-like enzyme